MSDGTQCDVRPALQPDSAVCVKPQGHDGPHKDKDGCWWGPYCPDCGEPAEVIGSCGSEFHSEERSERDVLAARLAEVEAENKELEAALTLAESDETAERRLKCKDCADTGIYLPSHDLPEEQCSCIAGELHYLSYRCESIEAERDRLAQELEDANAKARTLDGLADRFYRERDEAVELLRDARTWMGQPFHGTSDCPVIERARRVDEFLARFPVKEGDA